MSLLPLLRLAHTHTPAQPILHQFVACLLMVLALQQLPGQFQICDRYEESVKDPTATQRSILAEVLCAVLEEICQN